KVWLLKKLEKGRVWPHIYTLFLVVVGWAIFVANDGGAGLGLLMSKLFLPSAGIGIGYYLRNYGVVLLAAIFFSTKLPEKIYEKIQQHQALRIAVLAVILLLALPYMANAGYSPFLYFRF
ncbi:MAG: MBOAT family protein, partial [Oscillospiraceae bacterium]|nr:MBOAT family protein [Oscillospiraceae bacterium]